MVDRDRAWWCGCFSSEMLFFILLFCLLFCSNNGRGLVLGVPFPFNNIRE